LTITNISFFCKFSKIFNIPFKKYGRIRQYISIVSLGLYGGRRTQDGGLMIVLLGKGNDNYKIMRGLMKMIIKLVADDDDSLSSIIFFNPKR
jgi:hypothetical protein